MMFLNAIYYRKKNPKSKQASKQTNLKASQMLTGSQTIIHTTEQMATETLGIIHLFNTLTSFF